MVVDINLFRKAKGGDPAMVADSQRRRFKDGNVCFELAGLDEKQVKDQYDLEKMRAGYNKFNKMIGEARKNKTDEDKITSMRAESVKMKADMAEVEANMKETILKSGKLLHSIGNLLDSRVHVSQDESKSPVIRTWSPSTSLPVSKLEKSRIRSHHELLRRIGGVDFKRGVELAGHRQYFLKGPGVLLLQALIQHGLGWLVRRKWTPIYPPVMMRKDTMSLTAELADFDETLYKLDGGKDEGDNPTYLIATSEQPISALHKNQTLCSKDLPIRYAGYSQCFRKEAGSHGKDTWGIFRVHQFDKVEQFVLCHADDSETMHQEMMQTSQSFYESLNLPYRVISVVSGSLNNAAALKYDLEAWFPGYDDFRELVSCSNCTDYQSRDLQVRVDKPENQKRADDTQEARKQDKSGDKSNSTIQLKTSPFVHMLNGTLCAAQRTMCCILENYQTQEGIQIPDALKPYMYDITSLPFVEPFDATDCA